MVATVDIRWPGGVVTGRVAGDGAVGMLLAHGAGTGQDHPFMVALRDALAHRGLRVMTFDYPYRQRGSRRPDALPRLVECHRAAAETLLETTAEVFLGGRSMGGRVATHLVAEGFPAGGVVLYAYPLHPPGREDRLRVEHLARVAAPMLFFQGTRDALSRMELFDRHIRPLPGATVEILDGADHGFRSAGRTALDLVEHLAEVTVAWVSSVSSGTRSGPGP